MFECYRLSFYSRHTFKGNAVKYLSMSWLLADFISILVYYFVHNIDPFYRFFNDALYSRLDISCTQAFFYARSHFTIIFAFALFSIVLQCRFFSLSTTTWASREHPSAHCIIAAASRLKRREQLWKFHIMHRICRACLWIEALFVLDKSAMKHGS